MMGLALTALLQATGTAASLPRSVGECREVHGRMTFANGTPSVRIWVIGTHRMLGVLDTDNPFLKLPPKILAQWRRLDTDAQWGAGLYGDYRVCALSRQHEGRMQSVRIEAARNVVIRPRD